VESAYAALRATSVELYACAADVERLQPPHAEAIEQALFDVLGVPVPEIRLVPSKTAAPGWLEPWVAGIPGLPTRGLGAGELLAEAPERLASEGIEATPVVHPVFATPAALVATELRPRLEQAGIPYVDADGLLETVITNALDCQRTRLLAIDDLEHQLALLRDAFPAVVHAATASFALGDLLKITRLLLEEHLPVRDLRSLLNCLLDYDSPASDENGSGPDPNLEPCADFVRDGLVDYFAARHAPDGRATVVRVEATLEARVRELGQADQDKLRAATRDLLTTAGSPPTPIVLTTRAARRPLHDILSAELPSVPVLAHSELPLQVERATLGTIVLPAIT
jgi:flagellar biosynthesis component FlhA